MPKNQVDRVVGKVGVRPKSATKIGQQLGYPDHRGVARALREAVDQGKIVKTPKGYQQA